MGLVGDLIVHVRENGPDPASFLATPTFTLTDGGAGGTLAAGTYYVQVTAINQWGESSAAAELFVAVAVNHKLTITITSLNTTGVTDYRVYISLGTPGAENGFFLGSQLGGGTVFTVTTLTGMVAGVPPVRATAMLPDTDGGYVSAFTLYRWINDALRKGCRIGGGLPVATGVQGITNVGTYRLQGRWTHITYGWFDGWPMNPGKKADIFKHNLVSGIPGIMSMEQNVDSTVVQLWPQANRTGSSTTLSAPMGLTDTSAAVVASTGFLSLGLAQIDSEIVTYFGVGGNTLAGLTRGYGGTLATTHLAGAPVVELNLSFTGFAMPVDYGPGDSGKVLPIPPGWEEPLQDYLVARFKKTELSNQEALAIEKQFEASMKMIAKESRPRKGPAQIGGVGGTETLPGGAGGGIILT